MTKLTKGHFYLCRIDGYNAESIVKNTAGAVRSADLDTAQRMARAFAEQFPACMFAVREARNTRTLGPMIDNAKGVRFLGALEG